MGFGFSFQGVSGQYYTYALIDMRDPNLLPKMAGSYVFARQGAEPTPVYFGETDGVFKEITTSPLWSLAQSKYGATLFYFHMGLDPVRRRAEQADLIEKYHPPMNTDTQT